MTLKGFSCFTLHMPKWHRRRSSEVASPLNLPPAPTHAAEMARTPSPDDEKTAAHAHAHAHAEQADVLPRPESTRPGHGEEIVSEWREGPHLVIERQRSDLDVEVEVIRNAFRQDGVATFSGTRDKVVREVREHLDSIGHRVEGIFMRTPSRTPDTAPPK